MPVQETPNSQRILNFSSAACAKGRQGLATTATGNDRLTQLMEVSALALRSLGPVSSEALQLSRAITRCGEACREFSEGQCSRALLHLGHASGALRLGLIAEQESQYWGRPNPALRFMQAARENLAHCIFEGSRFANQGDPTLLQESRAFLELAAMALISASNLPSATANRKIGLS